MKAVALPALRTVFALLLLATGAAKLLDMAGFATIVSTYGLLPQTLVLPAAWALALAELALGGWLVWGRYLRRAAVLLVLLHLMYLAWTLVALLRGLQLANCGCFGVYLARPLSWSTPLEDLLLIGLALGLWQAARRRPA